METKTLMILEVSYTHESVGVVKSRKAIKSVSRLFIYLLVGPAIGGLLKKLYLVRKSKV